MQFYLKVSFSTKRLASGLGNSEAELNAKVLFVSIFEGKDLHITITLNHMFITTVTDAMKSYCGFRGTGVIHCRLLYFGLNILVLSKSVVSF